MEWLSFAAYLYRTLYCYHPEKSLSSVNQTEAIVQLQGRLFLRAAEKRTEQALQLHIIHIWFYMWLVSRQFCLAFLPAVQILLTFSFIFMCTVVFKLPFEGILDLEFLSCKISKGTWASLYNIVFCNNTMILEMFWDTVSENMRQAAM